VRAAGRALLLAALHPVFPLTFSHAFQGTHPACHPTFNQLQPKQLQPTSLNQIHPTTPNIPPPKHPQTPRPDGDVAAALAVVDKKMPRRIKRKRAAGPGSEALEEYYDYVFPEEAGGAPNLKLLEAAMRWKRQKMGAEEGGG
jgi:hypothetical protein